MNAKKIKLVSFSIKELTINEQGVCVSYQTIYNLGGNLNKMNTKLIIETLRKELK